MNVPMFDTNPAIHSERYTRMRNGDHGDGALAADGTLSSGMERMAQFHTHSRNAVNTAIPTPIMSTMCLVRSDTSHAAASAHM